MIFSTLNASFFLNCFKRLTWIGILLLPALVFAQQWASLSIGAHKIQAEIANTGYLRQKGLMNRAFLLPNRGMIFIFDQERTHCMWMKNTPLNLSVAFIDPLGRIINIEKMQAHSTKTHCAKLPARYALEMEENFFENKNIVRGMRLNGLDKLPRAH